MPGEEADGEAQSATASSSRAVPLAKSGEFDFTWNGAIRDTGNWAVLKGGPNTANGLRFLDFFVQNPAAHLPFSTDVSIDSNNREAAAQIPPEERRFRSSYAENYEKLIIADYEWIASVRPKLRERWISWLTQ